MARRRSGQASCYLPIVPDVGDIYRALADPTRRALLDALTATDGQTLFALCGALLERGFSPTRQAVSQHLAVLEDAGLVTVRRQGRYKFHDIDTRPLREIAQRWPEPPGAT
nr:metalloregulator ArsR/SmtB family transcription factor [Pseudonocardia sp. ICBG1142]